MFWLGAVARRTWAASGRPHPNRSCACIGTSSAPRVADLGDAAPDHLPHDAEAVAAALRESEARYRLIAENASDALAVYGPEGRVRYMSPAMLRILGRTAEQRLGRSGYENVLEADQPMLRAFGRRIVDERTAGVVAYRVRHQDGRIVWLESTLRAVLDEAGAVAEVHAVIRDITDRKEVELALAASRERLSRIIETMAEGVLIRDREGRAVQVNRMWERIMRKERSSIVGSPLGPVPWRGWRPDGTPLTRDDFPAARVAATHEPIYNVEFQIEHENGERQVLSHNAAPLFDADGDFDGTITTFTDITERKATELALAASEARLASIIETMADAVLIRDREGRCVQVNRTWEQIMRIERSEVIGKIELPAGRVLRLDGTPMPAEGGPLARVRASGEPVYGLEMVVEHRDGDRTVLAVNAAPLFDVNGAFDGAVISSTDITEKKSVELALTWAEARFRALTENATDIVVVVDAAGTILYLSPSFRRLFGWNHEHLVGTSVFAGVHPEDQAMLRARLAEIMARPGVGEPATFRQLHRNGSWRHLEVIGNNQIDDPGVNLSVGGIVFNARDVTERVELEAQLARLALHDPLTDLPNRRLLCERLAGALTRLARTPALVGVLYLDLDGFKTVNDHLGHTADDALLVQVAERLVACVRPSDTVARFGGDEFAVLLDQVSSPDDLIPIAERMIASLSRPYVLDGEQARVGVSIGISLADAAGREAEALLREADQALYLAKRAGKGRFVIQHTATTPTGG